MTASLDHILFHFINQDCANPALDAICPILRNKNTWLPFYIIGGLWILYKYKWQGLWIIALAGLAILVSDQSSNLIKHLVHRIRPCATGEQVRLLVDHCSDSFSFTSSHAANHFALAVFLSFIFYRYRWITPMLLVWASLIALSQVYVGLHYPADIAAGGVLGASVGWCIYRLYFLSPIFRVL
jgi:undecaprenyl-diphosphatase